MRFDRTTIAMTPRRTDGCLDMAMMFVGRHLRGVLGLWLTAAAPCGLTVYMLGRLFDFGLWLPLVVVYFASGLLSAPLVTATTDAAFGRKFRAKNALASTLRYRLGLLGRALLLRLGCALGLLLCVIPGILLSVKTGFAIEKELLKNPRDVRESAHADELLKNEFSDLLLRGSLIFLFCAALWVVVFFTVDLGVQMLTGISIFSGRIADAVASYDPFEYAVQLFWYDPLVQSAVAATVLLVYPLGRLAWFFCYIDVQVRRDCWDLQVQFLQEARRLMEGLDGRNAGEAA